jgi:hypothetical protein
MIGCFKINNQIVSKTLLFLHTYFFLRRKSEMDSITIIEHGQMLSSAQINSEPSEEDV